MDPYNNCYYHPFPNFENSSVGANQYEYVYGYHPHDDYQSNNSPNNSSSSSPYFPPPDQLFTTYPSRARTSEMTHQPHYTHCNVANSTSYGNNIMTPTTVMPASSASIANTTTNTAAAADITVATTDITVAAADIAVATTDITVAAAVAKTANIQHLPPKVQKVLENARTHKNFSEEKILTDDKALSGWILHTHVRSTSSNRNHVDRYWYTPKTGKKMRSVPEVKKFVEFLEDTNGDEEQAWQLLRKNKSRQTPTIEKSTTTISNDNKEDPVKKRTKKETASNNEKSDNDTSNSNNNDKPSKRIKKDSKVKKEEAKQDATSSHLSQGRNSQSKNNDIVLLKNISESKLTASKPLEEMSLKIENFIAEAEAKSPNLEHQHLVASKTKALDQQIDPSSTSVLLIDPELPQIAESK